MQFIMKTPRLHRQFIEQNGLDKFVDKFSQIVVEYQNVRH